MNIQKINFSKKLIDGQRQSKINGGRRKGDSSI
jgi:hypothetical protein